MKLRPYQLDAIAAVRSAWASGIQDVLTVMATGAGKTQTFLSLLMQELDADPSARALVIAHRQELIEQPIERIAQMDKAWLMSDALDKPRVGMLMGKYNDCDRQLTVATVQTLTSPKRLAALLRHGPITHLVIDECHHATAESYVTLWRALREKNPALLHLGVTATPQRADGDGLSKVYGHVAAKVTIADLVRQGYLVQPRWLAISTGISLAGVHTRSGDYVASELAQRFDTPSGRTIIVQSYLKYAAGRRSIAFTASVDGARELAAAFNAAGVSARSVDGTTPKDERAVIMADFRAGRFQILTNCQVATEGFDAPGTNCVLMCRPTRSDALYIQCMGRGLRPALGMAQPGDDCLILDFMPADSRNIVMAGDVLGLPKDVTRTVLEENADEEPGEVQAGFTFDGENFNTGGTPMEIISRELNYMEQSPYVWHRRDGLLTLGLGQGRDGRDRILIIRDDDLYGCWKDDGQRTWQVMPIARPEGVTVGERAQEIADNHAMAALANKGRSWHKELASDKQIAYLKKLVRNETIKPVLSNLKRLDAADLITHYIAKTALENHLRGA